MGFNELSKRNQNANLMVTTIDDDGNVSLIEIPICIEPDILDAVSKTCICNNKAIIEHQVDCSEHEFWKSYWDINIER